MSSNLIFETLNDEHLSGALRMSSNVGWPHRKEDWAFVLSISNGVVAIDGDRVVATALATFFPPVGMVNMIIVDAAFRGCGLGRDVMCRAMRKIAPDAWRLVSTKDGLPLYEKAGFHVTGEILQHQGLVKPISPIGSAEWATADNVRAMAALDTAAAYLPRCCWFEVSFCVGGGGKKEVGELGVRLSLGNNMGLCSRSRTTHRHWAPKNFCKVSFYFLPLLGYRVMLGF